MVRKNKSKAITPKSDETKLAVPRRHEDPYAWFDEMDRRFDEVRRDFFDHWGLTRFASDAPESHLGVRQPLVDLVDEGHEFVFRAELPGVPKEEVDLNVTSDGIEVRAQARGEREETEKDYYFSEHSYRALHRSLSFPAEVLADRAQASLKDGVLEVRVPKKEPTPERKPTKVRVE